MPICLLLTTRLPGQAARSNRCVKRPPALHPPSCCMQALTSPLSGLVGDRYDRSYVVAFGCLLWGVMTAAIGLSRSLGQALVSCAGAAGDGGPVGWAPASRVARPAAGALHCMLWQHAAWRRRHAMQVLRMRGAARPAAPVGSPARSQRVWPGAGHPLRELHHS